MSTFNPDYPTSNTAGFIQHTYQTPQQNDLMYFYGGGMSFNPYSTNMMPINDSRRNTMNPVNPFNQFGQTSTQSTCIPESMVQPFSSYPPSTPVNGGMTPPTCGGLNSFIESRRNTPVQPQNNNPWATQQTPPTPSQQTFTNPTPPMSGWFDGCGVPGYNVNMNTMALYGGSVSGFDKHQSWDNYFSQNRIIPAPNIDWHAQSAPQACYNQPIPYPVQQFPTAQANWKEIAEKNWSSANL